MNSDQDIRGNLFRVAVDHDQKSAEYAKIAAARLAELDFSAAATACHRAYQHQLIARALGKQANL